jgi:hypothetical protein
LHSDNPVTPFEKEVMVIGIQETFQIPFCLLVILEVCFPLLELTCYRSEVLCRVSAKTDKGKQDNSDQGKNVSGSHVPLLFLAE